MLYLIFSLLTKKHHPFCAHPNKKNRPHVLLGTNRHSRVMNRKFSHLRKQYFSCKCAILAIAADVSSHSYQTHPHTGFDRPARAPFLRPPKIQNLFIPHKLLCSTVKHRAELFFLYRLHKIVQHRNRRRLQFCTSCFLFNNPDQFLKLWIGAGILPPRFTNASQEKEFTGMTGA